MSRPTVILAALALFSALSTERGVGQTHVFHRYALSTHASVDTAVQDVTDALAENEYEILASYMPGQPDDCSYQSRVIVAANTADMNELLGANPDTAPFFAVTRLVVYEDRSGIFVATPNPLSILRTVLMDEPAAEDLAESRDERLESALGMVDGIAGGRVGYGQERGRGHIGKTMGVMAGGSFDSKIDNVYVTPSPPDDVARLIQESFGTPAGDWNLDVQYVLPLPNNSGFLVGITGDAMESKSFEIVGAGAEKERAGYPCAGVAHAASYPIELYLAPVDAGTEIRTVSAMYRMKMYFEDAGKWAFMKNMGMPGSIADEITRRIEYALSSEAGL